MWHVESVAVAREYAHSENGKQREAAAGSPLTPAAYLGRLVYDPGMSVSSPTCRRVPACSACSPLSKIGGVRCDVANRVGVPPDALATLAYDEEERVRETAFLRKEMPEYVYDDVIVCDLDKADRVYEAVDASRSVTAHMLSVMRLAPPYANRDEAHAFEGLYVKSRKWLEERGIELE